MKNEIRIDSFVNSLCNNTTVDLRRHDALWQHTANIISAVATVKFHVYLLILTTSAVETSRSWTTTHNSQMPKTLQNTSHLVQSCFQLNTVSQIVFSRVFLHACFDNNVPESTANINISASKTCRKASCHSWQWSRRTTNLYLFTIRRLRLILTRQGVADMKKNCKHSAENKKNTAGAGPRIPVRNTQTCQWQSQIQTKHAVLQPMRADFHKQVVECGKVNDKEGRAGAVESKPGYQGTYADG